ncbi:MAG: polysaccharide biosynthesis tyrosine autokinase [Plectolyngbya sp. WJT66-NPBG17]|jgi:capsular exopolysaccharide synthesis family protein|nr:polysaccharide biosynthesis tyrosine autokinase [Plectolyngbya sp. WJT66-NPBG17]
MSNTSYVSASQPEGIDLQQYWTTLKRRWKPAVGVFGTTVTLGCVAILLQKPVYEGSGQILLKVDPLSRLTGVISPDSEAVAAGAANTEVEVIKSVPLAQNTIDALDLVDESGEALKLRNFVRRLSVKVPRGTNTISISFKSKDPTEAANVVNKLMSLYLERNRLSNRAEATAARNFIEKQLPETEFRVQKASKALTQFKQQNRFIAADDEAKAFSANLQKLEENINEAQALLSNSQARTVSVERLLNIEPKEGITLSALSQSPGVQKPLEELQDIQSQLARARVTYQEKAPLVVSLKGREARIQELLQQRIQEVTGEKATFQGGDIQLGKLREDLIQELIKAEVERSGYEKQFSTLTNQYSTSRRRSIALAELEQAQRQLLLNLNTAQSTYETLLKSLQEVRLAENQNIGNAQVIASAIPPDEPVAPKKVLYLAAAAALGLILGVLTAFILEYRDSTLKTSRDAREVFRYPLLGVIPASEQNDNQLRNGERQGSFEISVRDNPHSFISEIYRMVFANLKLFHADQGDCKIVVVASSIAGEGKSTLAANLALAASEAGNRTLLIDADMRRPRQHTMWNLSTRDGLSDVLSGRLEPQNVIQQSEGLDILPSGNLSSNPSPLINSNRMRWLIQAFSKSYDFVVIDTSPLLISADASIIAKMTDGVLLAVRPGVVAQQDAVRAQELLQQSGQRILGQVVNADSSSIELGNQPYYNQDYYQNGQATTGKFRKSWN